MKEKIAQELFIILNVEWNLQAVNQLDRMQWINDVRICNMLVFLHLKEK